MQAPFTRTYDATLPIEARALLDSIAGSEAPGYNTLYGGRSFSSFADHPRQDIPILSGPNAGKTSSAAGRYQFLGSTWDDAQKALGLPDFSERSQDQGAWWLAQRDYRQRTGRELLGDIRGAGGDPEQLNNIGRQLSGTWTSLPTGIERNGATDSFGNRFTQHLTYYSDGSTPSSPMVSAFAEQKKMADPITPLRPGEPGEGWLNKLAAGGPGALFGAPGGVAQYTDETGVQRGGGYDIGNSLQGAAAWLQSIHDPKAAAAMIANLQKAPGKWGYHRDPDTGQQMLIRDNDGATRFLSAGDPNHKFKQQYQNDEAKGFAELNGKMAGSATDVAQQLNEVGAIRDLFSNDSVYQGTFGAKLQDAKKLAQSMGIQVEGVSEADLARALSNQYTLRMRQYAGGMPGSLSDKDLAFLKEGTFGLDRDKAANLTLVDMYERSLKRTQALDKIRSDYVAKNGMLNNGFYDAIRQHDLQNPQTPIALPQTSAKKATGGSRIISVQMPQ